MSVIPKKIHYCWFGGSPKSELIERCIESWRRYLPDYEIVEWNESSFDIHVCPYVEQAYERKKWAFVADYCRIWALYREGGVYFDTDVEVIRDPQGVLDAPCVGFESPRLVNPGLVMASEAGDWLCRSMLDEYNTDVFIMEDGSSNYRTICDRMTRFLTEKGLRLDNSLQEIGGYTVYPTEYFNPYNSKKDRFDLTDRTVTVHRFLASWQDEESVAAASKSANLNGRIFALLVKLFGLNNARRIRKFLKHPFRKERKE